MNPTFELNQAANIRMITTRGNPPVFSDPKTDPNPDGIKWRMPSVAGLPNPVLVVMANYGFITEAFTLDSGDEMRLGYGPALPNISDDGLEIFVFIKLRSSSQPKLLWSDLVLLGQSVVEQCFKLTEIDEPFEVIIACGPGPKGDPRADWLAVTELIVSDGKEYSLRKARANKELRTRNEIAHFSRSYRQPMFQKEAKQNAFAYAQQKIQASVIQKPINFAARALALCKQKKLKILALCCGAARVEEGLFRNVATKPEITLVDINADLLQMAAERLKNVAECSVLVGDANELKLPKSTYDLVICVAALHHIVELELLFLEIGSCLVEGGEFWSIGEYVGRNGARLWPESYEVANGVFSLLPSRLRKNNLSVRDPKPIESILPNIDCSLNTFEGIRAEEIDGLLGEYFDVIAINRWSTIAWRVIGPAYVDNYDLDDPNDLKVVDDIVRIDVEKLQYGELRPVGMRGIFIPKRS